MKKLVLIIIISSVITYGQFKEELNKPIDIKGSFVNNNVPSLLLGFFNPENFSMNHSFSMSYSAFGSNGMALGVYTNSMNYNFSESLNLQVDASIVNSPYSTFGNGFAEQINGIYLSRAALNYKPNEDFSISIQYRKLPGSSYYPYGNRYNSMFDYGFFGR